MSLSDRESEADRREASMRTGSNATRERAARGLSTHDLKCGAVCGRCSFHRIFYEIS